MVEKDKLIEKFKKNGGILKTSELNTLGLTSRQIKKLLEEGEISKIKQGYYEFSDAVNPEEVIIARLFPKAVIFLESALLHYNYTDRIPTAWQIAVDRDSEKNQYKIEYPLIEPYYQSRKFLNMGVATFEVQGIKVRIFDRDRTICDIIRYEKKLEKEVFTNAVMRYIKDPKMNLRYLFEYAKVLNMTNKVQTQIGKWL